MNHRVERAVRFEDRLERLRHADVAGAMTHEFMQFEVGRRPRDQVHPRLMALNQIAGKHPSQTARATQHQIVPAFAQGQARYAAVQRCPFEVADGIAVLGDVHRCRGGMCGAVAERAVQGGYSEIAQAEGIDAQVGILATGSLGQPQAGRIQRITDILAGWSCKGSAGNHIDPCAL
ncbi:hypothetical protein V476_10505 [Pseudomonas syringae KCTC 12500]|nr:hypothetical protein V476_10505 [Pseudomonas syringae KCTC 12500]